MPLINCETNTILTWSANCIIACHPAANKIKTFAKSDTKLYVPVVTLSNAKLLEYLKSGFKRTINWNKHQSKTTIQRQNQYLDYLIDPSLQGVKSIFVLSFENNVHKTLHTKYIFFQL